MQQRPDRIWLPFSKRLLRRSELGPLTLLLLVLHESGLLLPLSRHPTRVPQDQHESALQLRQQRDVQVLLVPVLLLQTKVSQLQSS
jgi:hypothetical protein